MRMTEQERRIRIRHLKRMYRIRERKERHDKKVSGLFMKRVVFTLILAAFIFTVVMIFVFLRIEFPSHHTIVRLFQADSFCITAGVFLPCDVFIFIR